MQPGKKTWRDIRNYLIAPKKTQSRTSTAAADPGWADRLNTFFAGVGPGVVRSLAAADDGRHRCRLARRACVFVPRPATLPELSAALSRMGTPRSCGPDGITTHMLRITFPVVAPHLLTIVNSCISRCGLPVEWKEATVTPLHKKGDTEDPNNYRPASILPTVAKLCERVVCSQLMTSLTRQHIICPQLYGFRPGLSTESALLDAVSYATDCVDNGQVAPLVTIDTSKAFDSVEHIRLLDKLGWSHGIEQTWFAAWLRDRHQKVKGGTDSEPITHGVVQGSILGPVLFLLFTNDLTQHLPGTKIIMYADDTQFFDFDSPKNTDELKTRMENTLSTALHWLTQNRLNINPNKTEMVIFQSKRIRDNPNFSISFDTETIYPSQSAKLLCRCLSRLPLIMARLHILRCS